MEDFIATVLKYDSGWGFFIVCLLILSKKDFKFKLSWKEWSKKSTHE